MSNFTFGKVNESSQELITLSISMEIIHLLQENHKIGNQGTTFWL